MEGLGAKIDTCHSKSVYGLIYERDQACQILKCKDFNYNLMLKIVFFFLENLLKDIFKEKNMFWMVNMLKDASFAFLVSFLK